MKIGQTIPLDPEGFPAVKDEYYQFVRIIGDDKPYSALSMTREIMDFPIITGGPGEATMKNFLKYTTKNLKKIVLEEKFFKAWYHGRGVLLGNGSGATNSIHDAILLANYIVSLPHWYEQKDIDHRFKAYQDERMPWIKEAFESNKPFKGMIEKNFKATMIRLYAKPMTAAVARSAMMKMNSNRPQAAFLEEVSHASPTSPVLISKSSLTSALAAIAEASAIATARLAASAAAAAASLPKNALESFQNTPSKAKKPTITIV
ncbi:hypothetical protein BGZ47_004898 [Haplosporangium gracile]|nr:hypothetical protein BGZ47_004898 [Haplosporangium gracile]